MNRTRQKQFQVLKQYIDQNDLRRSRMLIENHMGSDISDFPEGDHVLGDLIDKKQIEMIYLLVKNNFFYRWMISGVLINFNTINEDWIINTIRENFNKLTKTDLDNYLFRSLQSGTHKVSKYLIEQGATILGVESDDVINNTILEIALKNDFVSLQIIDDLGIKLKDDPYLSNDVNVYARHIIEKGYYDAFYYLYGYPIFEEKIQANKKYWLKMVEELMIKMDAIDFTELYDIYEMIYNLIVFGPFAQ